MRPRILIVEDEPDTCELVADLLEGAGYETACARDGMEALFSTKVSVPDLVVLDLGLPRLDGVYVAELWKRDPAMRDVPILIVSAHLDAHNRARALAIPGVETMEKPFTPAALLSAIGRILGADRRTAG